MDVLFKDQIKLIDILAVDNAAKSCALLVKLATEDEHQAVIVLERMSWGRDHLERHLANITSQCKEDSSRITLLESNSCYYKYTIRVIYDLDLP